MTKLVTIGIPVYKRLNTLSNALQSVAAQDYPHIELIVSDNGMNGTKVRDIVEQWYPRSHRFRQNPVTVNIAAHYNQLLEAASGEFFVALDDDDTISPNFASELVGIFDRHPDVTVALARQKVVDEAGKVMRESSDRLPEIVSGEEFIRSWSKYGFECYTTMIGITSEMRRCGGFPHFPNGTHVDDAMLIKLCLGNSVGFGTNCFANWRWAETSFGWSLKLKELAQDTVEFHQFLTHDPVVLSYAGRHPDRWTELRAALGRMNWHTYFDRWDTMYKKRMSYGQWVKAAFALPYIPEYYRYVRSSLRYGTQEELINQLKAHLPWAQALYRTLTGRAKPSNK